MRSVPGAVATGSPREAWRSYQNHLRPKGAMSPLRVTGAVARLLGRASTASRHLHPSATRTSISPAQLTPTDKSVGYFHSSALRTHFVAQFRGIPSLEIPRDLRANPFSNGN